MSNPFEKQYKLANIRVEREKCGRNLIALFNETMTTKHNIGLDHNVRFYVADKDPNKRTAIGWIVGIGYEGDISKHDERHAVRLSVLIYQSMVPVVADLIKHMNSEHYGIAHSTRKEDEDEATKSFGRDQLESITIVRSVVTEKAPVAAATVVSQDDESNYNEIVFTVPKGTKMDRIQDYIDNGMVIGCHFESEDEWRTIMNEMSGSMIKMQEIDLFHAGLVGKKLELISSSDDLDTYMLTYYDAGYGNIKIRTRKLLKTDTNECTVIAIDTHCCHDIPKYLGTDVITSNATTVDDEDDDSDDMVYEQIARYKVSHRVYTKLSDLYGANKFQIGNVFRTTADLMKYYEENPGGGPITPYVPGPDDHKFIVHSIEFTNGSDEMEIYFEGVTTVTFVPHIRENEVTRFDVVLYGDDLDE